MLLTLAGSIGAVLGYLSGWLAVASGPAYLVGAVFWRAVRRRRLRNIVDEVLNELRIRQVV